MLLNFIKKYTDNFKGFSKEIWILTLITYINRAGTMVIPFLSKYLKEDLSFSYSDVATILVWFGIGSVAGSWLGGKLSDMIGYYKIMIISLLLSGVLFILLQYVTEFDALCFGMFLIMLIADMFRPAMFVSLSAYSTPENRTRALTLVRLAVNLGFASGPAIGGLIIMGMGYKGLFWVDGLTCIIAILIFWVFVKNKKIHKKHNQEEIVIDNRSILADIPFWTFLVNCIVTGILFFQLFVTLPLYESEYFKLTEFQIGLLLTLNGLLIFFFEMFIVDVSERRKYDKVILSTIGSAMMTLSIFLLCFQQWAGILVFMMIFMTFGEMFNFPFANGFAMSRAPKGKEGIYMGVFTMTFSLAHILSSYFGLNLVEKYGYFYNFLIMGCIGIIGTLFGYLTYYLLNKNKDIKS